MLYVLLVESLKQFIVTDERNWERKEKKQRQVFECNQSTKIPYIHSSTSAHLVLRLIHTDRERKRASERHLQWQCNAQICNDSMRCDNVIGIERMKCQRKILKLSNARPTKAHCITLI